MQASYRHTQVGYVILSAFASAAVGIAVGLLVNPKTHAALPVLVVLVLCMALFPTLTAEVNDGRVRLFFGLGLIRRTISLTEVESVRTVRNAWYYGWGLRRIPDGWMWNVSGLSAVELRLKSGRVFRIGTDQPELLNRAIANALRPEAT